MSWRTTWAIAERVLRQLRRDPRTIALLIVVPAVLMVILRYAFDGQPETFQRIGAPMLGLLAALQAIPRDVTIVMIEHDMDVALEFAERITVLHFGEVVVEGSRAEVVAHPKTREIYLGE